MGVDVVSISEFASTLATSAGQAFERSRFTEGEREYAAGRPERLASRWAAKEAVVKAIGTGFRGIRPIDIDIVHEVTGELRVVRNSTRPWPFESHDWEWSVSLAHDADVAIAFALAVATDLTEVDRPPMGSLQSKENIDG